MVVLTEHLILSRSRQSALENVKHINLWGNDLTDISVFQRMPNVEVVALSVNKISSLKDFEGCNDRIFHNSNM